MAALQAYDSAFATFFTRLASDGINTRNTLFVFSADEGDHFVGGAPSPAGCDGVVTPCTYSQIGEINANLAGLLATEQFITTPFKVHSDSAPAVYITGNPARTDPVTRIFERATGNLTAVNPITGDTDAITKFLADPVEQKLLHMITADPARTPTFILFADPNYFLFAGSPNCNSPCVTEQPGFAWNHGDVQRDITTTWLGMVGPGVDQAVSLAQALKQIDAPVGPLGLASLQASTVGLESNDPQDATYTSVENQLISFTTQRDALASPMLTLLEGAEFNNQPFQDVQANSLIQQAQALLANVEVFAGNP